MNGIYANHEITRNPKDDNKGFNSMLNASWIMVYGRICEQNNKRKKVKKEKVMYLEHHEIINKIA